MDPAEAGADIYKIHVKTRKIVRLTNQKFTPEHRGRELVERLPQAGAGEDALSSTACSTWGRARCPAAGSCSPATATASARPRATPPICLQLFVMDDRDTDHPDDDDADQPREDRPPEHRRRAAPGGARGWPHHVQHARIAGRPQRHPVGHLDDQPGRHQLEPAGQRVRPGRRAERLPLPDAALRRRDRGRGVLQPEQQRLRRLHQAAAAAAAGTATARRSARRT